MNRLETLSVDVGVHLCGAYIGVAKQFLNCPQVGAPVEEMRGETVP